MNANTHSNEDANINSEMGYYIDSLHASSKEDDTMYRVGTYYFSVMAGWISQTVKVVFLALLKQVQ